MSAVDQGANAVECAPPPVIPYLTIRGAATAIDWYRTVFGAVEQMRLPAEDGKRLMHAAIASMAARCS